MAPPLPGLGGPWQFGDPVPAGRTRASRLSIPAGSDDGRRMPVQCWGPAIIGCMAPPISLTSDLVSPAGGHLTTDLKPPLSACRGKAHAARRLAPNTIHRSVRRAVRRGGPNDCIPVVDKVRSTNGKTRAATLPGAERVPRSRGALLLYGVTAPLLASLSTHPPVGPRTAVRPSARPGTGLVDGGMRRGSARQR